MASKFLRKSLLKHIMPEDPVYVYEEYYDKKGKKKIKKRKRRIPEGLPKRDKKILEKTSKWARRLDIRGIAFCVGLVPVVGDAINFFLGYFTIIRRAKKADIPKQLIRRMYIRLIVQFLVGIIPLVGDILIALWGANSKNVLRLWKFLETRANPEYSDRE